MLRCAAPAVPRLPRSSRPWLINRRLTWGVIQRRRAGGGTAVLLTTHSMEEADLLADWIAIMAQGRCGGGQRLGAAGWYGCRRGWLCLSRLDCGRRAQACLL